jgi:hypothetical protein
MPRNTSMCRGWNEGMLGCREVLVRRSVWQPTQFGVPVWHVRQLGSYARLGVA